MTREAPYLYMDANRDYKVFVPAVRTNSVGTSWGGGPVNGSSLNIEKFFIATDELEDKELEFLGWRGPARAIKTIKRLSR